MPVKGWTLAGVCLGMLRVARAVHCVVVGVEEERSSDSLSTRQRSSASVSSVVARKAKPTFSAKQVLGLAGGGAWWSPLAIPGPSSGSQSHFWPSARARHRTRRPMFTSG